VAREAKRWTQRELAEQMTRAGCPIERSVIAKIEAGGTRTANVSLDEALALAAVLGLSPLYLFIEQDGNRMMAVTPKMPEASFFLRGWVRGQHPLHLSDEQFFWYMSPREEWKQFWVKPAAPAKESVKPQPPVAKRRKP